MSLMRKVAHNTALQFGGKIAGTLLGLGVTVLMLQYLGDEGYGNYTTAIVYLQLFGILMDLGLYIVMLKHINNESNVDGKLLNNIFTARAVTAITFLVVACSYVWFIPNYPEIVKWAVMVVAVNFFFITMNQLLMGVYQKHFAMGKVAIAEVLGKTGLFLGVAAVVYILQGGLLWIMASVVLGGFIQFTLLWVGLRKYIKIKPAFNWAIWKQLFVESWPVALSIGLNLIYFKADTIILSMFYDQATVGVYGAPYKVLEVIITLPAMIVGLLMPVLSKAYSSGDLPKFKLVYQQAFDAVLFIAIPLVVGTIMVAGPFMNLISGAEFTENQADLGRLLQVLVIAVGMIFVGTLTGYIIVIIEKQRTMLPAYGFVALTALAGYFYFIPRFSYFGAAGVTVYAETTVMLLATFIIYRTTKFVPNIKLAIRVALASGVMAVALYVAQGLPVVITILIGILVYPIGLLLFKAISKQQVQSFIKLRSS